MFSLGKFSNYLPLWNAEKGSVIFCDTPTSHICVNQWKFVGGIFSFYRNKCTKMTHEYTCSLLRVTLTSTSLYSTSFLLSPRPHYSLYHLKTHTKSTLFDSSLTPLMPLVSNSSMTFVTVSSFVDSLPHWIPSIPNIILKWVGMLIKSGFSSVV